MTPTDSILRASQGLFARHGLKKVTTDDIAREAHVSKSTIYAHYRNKQDILRAVVTMEMDQLWQRIDAAVEAEQTARGRLRAHLLTKFDGVRDLINLHQVTRENLAEHWEHAERLRQEFVDREVGLIETILEDGRRDEGLVVHDVAVTARLMAVSLRGLEDPWAIRGLGVSTVKQVDAMLTIILDGLRPRRGS